jgi:hypothetical protein
MNREGKLENVRREMIRHEINILGLSEVRWKGEGDFENQGVRVIYCGGKESQRGVAILFESETAKRVSDVVYHSDRLLLVRVKAEPVDMVIIQIYMPTTENDDEKIDKMYDQLEELIDKQKGTDSVIIMGDWNAVVGEERDGKEVGEFGLGKRNDRGEQLVDFCRRYKMMTANTWFKQEKRRRYTWKKPGDSGRYQIDYLLVRQRYRNSVKNARTYPGADADSDHNLVAMKMELKLKKIVRGKTQLKWDLEKLKVKKDAFKQDIEDQLTEREGMTVEMRWERLKDAVTKSARSNIGYKKKKIRKPWITETMIDKMEERRKWKNVNTDEGRKTYRKINNELRRETDSAKEKWWEKECCELEEMDRRGRSDLMYAKVHELTKKDAKSSRTAVIKDNNGKLLTEKEDVMNRWKEYIEILYDKDGKPTEEDIQLEQEDQIQEDYKGPEILKSEIEKAIDEMKNNKAEGVDGIPAELWKELGDKAKAEMNELCKDMYETGKLPKDFTRTILIPLQKKANATECGDFRTISLIAHASKVMLKVVTKRIEAKAKKFIGRNQFGFRKGCGTREAIGVLRMLCERNIENDNDVYICFVDFEKAFDRVSWVKMMECLKKLQVDWRDRRMIKELYMNQEALIRIAGGESEPGIIGRGVRQGCPLSPLLFSIYAEMMMIDAMEEIDEGMRVGGELLKDIRFADDQAMVASTEEGLQRIMNGLTNTARLYEMKVNAKKTKTMLVSKRPGREISILIEGQNLEQVTKFKYLGAIITENGKCDEEVRMRIGMAKDAFYKKKELLTKGFNRSLRKRIVKATIWTVAMYASETWTLRKEEIRRLEAFEMWVWRKMEDIRWTEKITNEKVLQAVEEERQLVEAIVERKKKWIGQILRGEGLMRDVMEGKMEGKRGRGRKRIGMINELLEGSYGSMKRKAEDGERWRCWKPWTCKTAEN